jgi:hypothetical protein
VITSSRALPSTAMHTPEQVDAIEPRLVETAYGKWLALAEPGSVLHFGVMGDSEQDARQRFLEARTKWQAIFQPDQGEAASAG